MENKTIFTFFKNCSKKVKISLMAVVALLLVGIICIIIFAPSGKTNISIETSLKEVFETSKLSTAEYTYNSIVAVPIDSSKPAEEENLKCQVAYKGTVKSGFDFKQINIVEKENALYVIVPKISIQSVDVKTDLEYIFIKKKYDTENTYAELLNICRDDLEYKAKNNKTFYETAVDSAVETVTAITKPFEKQLEDGMTIQVVYIDNYEKEVKQ